MKTSTQIDYLARALGEEKAIEMVAEAGFDAWDYSMFNLGEPDWHKHTYAPNLKHPLLQDNWKEYVLNLKRIGEEHGITCNQAHAPFPPTFEGIMPYIERAIEAAGLAGAKYIVVHPIENKGLIENEEYYKPLFEIAKKYNVKIATENMWIWDEKIGHVVSATNSNHNSFKEMMDYMHRDDFVACVDIGHAEMEGLETSAYKMLTNLGSYVKALHIHDNDLHNDSHELPFSMKIDYNQVVKALKEINYDGYLTLEADHYYVSKKAKTYEEMKACLDDLYRSVARLNKMMEEDNE